MSSRNTIVRYVLSDPYGLGPTGQSSSGLPSLWTDLTRDTGNETKELRKLFRNTTGYLLLGKFLLLLYFIHISVRKAPR